MKILIQHTERERTEMADIDDTYKTFKSYPKQAKKVKKISARSAFKKNVPKKLRKEWGARMQFFRSL